MQLSQARVNSTTPSPTPTAPTPRTRPLKAMSGRGAQEPRRAPPPPRPAVVAFDLDATLWTPEMYQMWGGAPFRRCPKTGRVEDRNGERLELMGHAPTVLEMLAAARARAGGEDKSDEHDDDEHDSDDHDDHPDALLLSDRGWEATEVAYVSRTEHADWAEDALRTFSFPLTIAGAEHGGSLLSSPRARRQAERRAARGRGGGGGGGSTAIPHLHALASHREIYPGSKVAHFKRIRERTGFEYREMLFFDNESWNVREVERLGVVSVYCPRGLTRAAWEEGVRKFAAAAAGGEAAATAPANSGARRKK